MRPVDKDLAQRIEPNHLSANINKAGTVLSFSDNPQFPPPFKFVAQLWLVPVTIDGKWAKDATGKRIFLGGFEWIRTAVDATAPGQIGRMPKSDLSANPTDADYHAYVSNFYKALPPNPPTMPKR
jgi:hypothetical protein